MVWKYVKFETEIMSFGGVTQGLIASENMPYRDELRPQTSLPHVVMDIP